MRQQREVETGLVDITELIAIKFWYEKKKDYFIISDRASITKLTSSVVDYISQGYSLFKTGYNFIDGPLEGIESSSVHVFAAPSNHGKSLFKLNLLKK